MLALLNRILFYTILTVSLTIGIFSGMFEHTIWIFLTEGLKIVVPCRLRENTAEIFSHVYLKLNFAVPFMAF